MADWKQVFNEGIGLVLGRWSALRFAIDNALGGGDPHVKAQRLAENIYSWFIQSKNLDVYDLETLLDEAMDSSFQLIHQEGSVEEVSIFFFKIFFYLYTFVNEHDCIGSGFCIHLLESLKIVIECLEGTCQPGILCAQLHRLIS